MTINWKAYDHVGNFYLFTAACLWAESMPEVIRGESTIGTHVVRDPEITSIYRGMFWYFLNYFESPEFVPTNESIDEGYRFRKSYIISRSLLVRYANHIGQRPKFLFPEERDCTKVGVSENQPENNYPDKQLDTRSYKSWRRLVKILAIASGDYPKKAGTVSKLLSIADRNGIKLSKDTIHDYLREAFEIDQDD